MNSNRLLIIDGNSIMNRAFYGIMGSRALTAPDGTYTNAIYGFLAVLFKELEDLKPDYIAVAFDLKAPTHRHKMYTEYKGTRHAMPDELAQQMPIIKEILKNMNITIIQKEGYEADDILGTISKQAAMEGHLVTILSGDRDTFQLASDKITIRIPRTKMGKTETEDYNESKIIEEYGVNPQALIQVKGLMGDTSDNIPGVPGVGEKTALKLIKEYQNIENIYEALEKGNTESIKGKLKERLIENKELAILSRTLGKILIDAPLGISVEELKIKEWDKEAVANIFNELQFNRFIDRFDLNGLGTHNEEKKIDDLLKIEEINNTKLETELEKVKQNKEFIYYIEKEATKDEKSIIKEKFKSLSFMVDGTVFYVKDFELNKSIIEIFQSPEIAKIGYKVKEDYIILKEQQIEYNNIKFDAEIAGYNLNSTDKNTLEEMAIKYLGIYISEYMENKFNSGNKNEATQMNLFDNVQNEDNREEKSKYYNSIVCYCISELKNVAIKKLQETRNNIIV